MMGLENGREWRSGVYIDILSRIEGREDKGKLSIGEEMEQFGATGLFY